MDTKFNTRNRFQMQISTEFDSTPNGFRAPDAQMQNSETVTPRQALAEVRKFEKLACDYWVAMWHRGERLSREQVREVLDLARDAEMGIAG